MSDHPDQPAHEDRLSDEPSVLSPQAARSFRSQLTAGEDVIDPETWAGSVPQATGIAPRARVGRSRWLKGLEFVADFADIGGGYGGYNQVHEFFGYRQSF